MVICPPPPRPIATMSGEGADDGGHAPYRDRRVGQRRRQITDRSAQRGIDEGSRRRPEEGTDGHLPQRNSERDERVRRQCIRDARYEPLAADGPQAAPLSLPVETVGAV